MSKKSKKTETFVLETPAAEVVESKVKKFKKTDSTRFLNYELADAARKELDKSVTSDQRTRVRYRKTDRAYDVVLYQR